MREWVTDFVTAALAYLSAKKRDEGRRGIKNCLKLCDAIYGGPYYKPLSILLFILRNCPVYTFE